MDLQAGGSALPSLSGPSEARRFDRSIFAIAAAAIISAVLSSGALSDRFYLLADLARRSADSGFASADPESQVAAEGPLHFLVLLAFESVGIDVATAVRLTLPLLLFAAGLAARILARDAGLLPSSAALAGVLVALDPFVATAAGTSGPAVTALVLAGGAALGRGREVLAGGALGIAAALHPLSILPSLVLIAAQIGPRRVFPTRALVLALGLAVPAALLSVRHGGAASLVTLGTGGAPGLLELFRYAILLVPFCAVALVREVSRRGAVLPLLLHGIAGGLLIAILGNGGDPGAIGPVSAALRVGGVAGADAFFALAAASAPRLARGAVLLALALFVVLECAAPAAAFRRALSGRAGSGEDLFPAVASYLRDEIPAEVSVAAFRVGALRAHSGRDVVNLTRGRIDKPRFFVDPADVDPWPAFDFIRPDVFVANADLGTEDRRILSHAEFYSRYRLLRPFRDGAAAVYVFARGVVRTDEEDEVSLVRPPDETGFPTREAARNHQVDFVDDGHFARPAIRLAPTAARRDKVGYYANLRAEPRLTFFVALRAPDGSPVTAGAAIAEVVAVSGARMETLTSVHLDAGSGGGWIGPIEIDLTRFAGTGVALSFEAAEGPEGDSHATVWIGDPVLSRVDGKVIAHDPPADLSRLVEARETGDGALAIEFDFLAAPRDPFTPSGDVSRLDAAPGRLAFRSRGADPFVLSPFVSLEESAYRFLDLELRATRDDGRMTDVLHASFARRSGGASGSAIEAEIACDGSPVRLRLPLRDAATPSGAGVVTQIRLDPLTGAGDVEIVRLALSRF